MSPGRYQLPGAIERYLAGLSKLYSQDGKRDLQEIVVNAQVRVHEEVSQDSWNGGVTGHALYLIVPQSLFLRSLKQKDSIQQALRDDINKLHTIQDEYIVEVLLEMDLPEDLNWRGESGLLLGGRPEVAPDSANRIWGAHGFRLFLSHKTSFKKETAELKNRLCLFGFAGFVAHEDIHPSKEWQGEIEDALASMDGFIALLTPDFHKSDWTDQEVGYAHARGVPLVTVRLGLDPYGFIAKFQAISSEWEELDVAIVKVLIKHDRALSAYIHALRDCRNFDSANTLAKVLPAIEKPSTRQIDEMVMAYNETDQLHGWGFTGARPGAHGPGLVHYLNLYGSRRFKLVAADRIEVIE